LQQHRFCDSHTLLAAIRGRGRRRHRRVSSARGAAAIRSAGCVGGTCRASGHGLRTVHARQARRTRRTAHASQQTTRVTRNIPDSHHKHSFSNPRGATRTTLSSEQDVHSLRVRGAPVRWRRRAAAINTAATAITTTIPRARHASTKLAQRRAYLTCWLIGEYAGDTGLQFMAPHSSGVRRRRAPHTAATREHPPPRASGRGSAWLRAVRRRHRRVRCEGRCDTSASARISDGQSTGAAGSAMSDGNVAGEAQEQKRRRTWRRRRETLRARACNDANGSGQRTHRCDTHCQHRRASHTCGRVRCQKSKRRSHMRTQQQPTRTQKVIASGIHAAVPANHTHPATSASMLRTCAQAITTTTLTHGSVHSNNTQRTDTAPGDVGANAAQPTTTQQRRSVRINQQSRRQRSGLTPGDVGEYAGEVGE
jgi:hypothetical protein